MILCGPLVRRRRWKVSPRGRKLGKAFRIFLYGCCTIKAEARGRGKGLSGSRHGRAVDVTRARSEHGRFRGIPRQGVNRKMVVPRGLGRTKGGVFRGPIPLQVESESFSRVSAGSVSKERGHRPAQLARALPRFRRPGCHFRSPGFLRDGETPSLLGRGACRGQGKRLVFNSSWYCLLVSRHVGREVEAASRQR